MSYLDDLDYTSSLILSFGCYCMRLLYYLKSIGHINTYLLDKLERTYMLTMETNKYLVHVVTSLDCRSKVGARLSQYNIIEIKHKHDRACILTMKSLKDYLLQCTTRL